VNLRKTLFILPNLFTRCSVFCGFFSITLSLGALSDGQSLHDLYQAALAI
jgi:CDP-diacylglycerol--serine O-phosphatidyltransferase